MKYGGDMKPIKLIMWMIFLMSFFLLLLASIGDVYEVIRNNGYRYFWFLMGFVVMLLLNAVNRRNREIFMKTHHELTHMVLGFITFKEIHRMKVEKQRGSVVVSGNNVLIETVTLAPYCLPLLAYVVMIFGFFFARDMSYAFYIFLGMAYMFHLLCIKFDFKSFKDMGRSQEDINQFPLLFSYSYILCFWLFNTMIILVTIRNNNIFKSFVFMFDSFKETIMNIF